jgi:hypothetical protein
MPNIELSISPDYVRTWGFTDAIRELYQNALDQEIISPDNELLFAYDPELMLLSIGNRYSTLDPSTLVLGNTTKHKNTHTIGQFGEGYKLALAVLLRLGKAVTIYNNPSVWTPSIKHSDTFNTAILNIHVVKYRFKELPIHDLIFQVKGVTQQEYQDVIGCNLHLQEAAESLDSPQGRILLDPKYKGHIYVKGLHITTIEKAHYGYDFNPEYITIGRDRDLVNEWDIFYQSSQMWAIQAGHVDLIDQMLGEAAPDIEHIDCYVYKVPKETVRVIGNTWYCKHPGCQPAANEAEARQARKLHGDKVKIVVVPAALMGILRLTDEYKQFTARSITKESPHDLLRRLIKYPADIKPKLLRELKAMVELSQHWEWKRRA